MSHRGPTHSLVITILIFLPVFILKGKTGVPYFLALVQHSLVGDFLTGKGIMVFWPLTTDFYGLGVEMMSVTNVLAEALPFTLALILMFLTGDMTFMLNPKKTSLLLIFPCGAMIPSIAGELPTPKELLIPHYIFLTFFLLILLRMILHYLRCRSSVESAHGC